MKKIIKKGEKSKKGKLLAVLTSTAFLFSGGFALVGCSDNETASIDDGSGSSYLVPSVDTMSLYTDQEKQLLVDSMKKFFKVDVDAPTTGADAILLYNIKTALASKAPEIFENNQISAADLITIADYLDRTEFKETSFFDALSFVKDENGDYTGQVVLNFVEFIDSFTEYIDLFRGTTHKLRGTLGKDAAIDILVDFIREAFVARQNDTAFKINSSEETWDAIEEVNRVYNEWAEKYTGDSYDGNGITEGRFFYDTYGNSDANTETLGYVLGEVLAKLKEKYSAPVLVSDKTVYVGYINNSSSEEEHDYENVVDIESAQDFYAAASFVNSSEEASSNYHVVWNIKEDIITTQPITISRRGIHVVINGNGHTITADKGTDYGTLSDYAFKFEGSRNYAQAVTINDLKLVVKDGFRHGIMLKRKTDYPSYAINTTLNNVEIEMAHENPPMKSGSQKYCTAIQNNDSTLNLRGNIKITTNNYCWAAIDLDNSNNDAYLNIDDYAELTIVDNRSEEKKNSEPVIKLNNENSENDIEVDGWEKHNLVEAANGYDIAPSQPEQDEPTESSATEGDTSRERYYFAFDFSGEKPVAYVYHAEANETTGIATVDGLKNKEGLEELEVSISKGQFYSTIYLRKYIEGGYYWDYETDRYYNLYAEFQTTNDINKLIQPSHEVTGSSYAAYAISNSFTINALEEQEQPEMDYTIDQYQTAYQILDALSDSDGFYKIRNAFEFLDREYVDGDWQDVSISSDTIAKLIINGADEVWNNEYDSDNKYTGPLAEWLYGMDWVYTYTLTDSGWSESYSGHREKATSYTAEGKTIYYNDIDISSEDFAEQSGIGVDILKDLVNGFSYNGTEYKSVIKIIDDKTEEIRQDVIEKYKADAHLFKSGTMSAVNMFLDVFGNLYTSEDKNVKTAVDTVTKSLFNLVDIVKRMSFGADNPTTIKGLKDLLKGIVSDGVSIDDVKDGDVAALLQEYVLELKEELEINGKFFEFPSEIYEAIENLSLPVNELRATLALISRFGGSPANSNLFGFVDIAGDALEFIPEKILHPIEDFINGIYDGYIDVLDTISKNNHSMAILDVAVDLIQDVDTMGNALNEFITNGGDIENSDLEDVLGETELKFSDRLVSDYDSVIYTLLKVIDMIPLGKTIEIDDSSASQFDSDASNFFSGVVESIAPGAAVAVTAPLQFIASLFGESLDIPDEFNVEEAVDVVAARSTVETISVTLNLLQESLKVLQHVSNTIDQKIDNNELTKATLTDIVKNLLLDETQMKIKIPKNELATIAGINLNSIFDKIASIDDPDSQGYSYVTALDIVEEFLFGDKDKITLGSFTINRPSKCTKQADKENNINTLAKAVDALVSAMMTDIVDKYEQYLTVISATLYASVNDQFNENAWKFMLIKGECEQLSPEEALWGYLFAESRDTVGAGTSKINHLFSKLKSAIKSLVKGGSTESDDGK